nr:U3 small nucleolar RNA associated protein 14 [Hymenolepis microstoma]
MERIPALPEANAWGLLKLKSGKKTKQKKLLKRLQVEASPIETPNELRDEKANRRLKFNLDRERLNLWKGPVHQNRLADQLIFPLQSKAIQFSTAEDAREAKHINAIESAKKNEDSLQAKLFGALYKNTVTPLTDADKEIQSQIELAKKMSLKAKDQMRQRLREVAFLRKAKQQKKIKSKNYHRRAKRRNMKEFEKNIALLRQNDPKAFAERLLEADRMRAKERASLRHRTGGKFARMQKLRAKYNDEAREAVAAMHDQGRDLKRKIRGEYDSDEESVLSELDISSSESEPESDFEESNLDGDGDDEGREDEMPSHLASWWAKVENQPTKSEAMDDDNDGTERPSTTHQTSTLLSTLATDELIRKSTTDTTAASGKMDLDPTDDNFFAALEEAVADQPDSGVAEFAAEKKAVEKEEAPEDLDTFLPGWNRWTGPGTEAIDEAIRKKKLVKAPKRKRLDKGRAKVIIRERVNEDLRKHLVKKIPFPYSTPEQYEAMMSQPVSREWTTEAAHKELTKPKIIVKAGRVIKPIDKDVALLREKDVRRLETGKKNV